MNQETKSPKLVPTGIAGLDNILGGGFTPNRVYLVEGDPGSGKTTLAMQFLLDGLRRGEVGLYVTLSETRDELQAVAKSHGWDLPADYVFELPGGDDATNPDSQYTMFHPSEVELGATSQVVLDEVERRKPTRVVFDSLSEMRLLAQNPLRYRRQILALKQFFIGKNCTVFLLDDRTSDSHDLQLQSIAHGVITLEQLAPEIRAERRRLRVVKMRGVRYRGGYHDFTIEKGGLAVYPRLVAAEHHQSRKSGALKSGIEALDRLLGGGLDRGTSALLMGPAGSGKSSFATQFICNVTKSGESAAMFSFDEALETTLKRAGGMCMDLRPHLESGKLHLQQIDPAELAPGQFVQIVRDAVEKKSASLVIIDSLNGYLNAMPQERFLTIQLHELLTYLGHRGVVTLLLVAQHGLVGAGMQAPVDASYLADTVIVFRYFELAGQVKQALSVMKKRSGAHERTLRELRLTAKGIEVGEPLSELHGVLTGLPTFNSMNRADSSEDRR